MSSLRALNTSTRSDLQDVIECPICCLRFERPLQLSCGHSFCGNCVDRLVADSRADLNRNENFDAVGGVPLVPNMNRAMDHPNVNRMDGGEMWLQFPRVAPAQPPLPGLGGFPYPRYLFRNIGGYDEPPPFIQRRVNVIGPAGNGDHVIKCPECRQPTRIPPEGLPVNYRLQEVLDRVAETSANVNFPQSTAEVDVPIHPRCSVCDDTMTKGVYFFCRTCVGESAHQLCSMCCLRVHNGHDIEERRFVTMNDVAVARETVSEATGRGYQAIDHTMDEFNTATSGAKEYLQSSTHNVLQAFEMIANEMQFELVFCHDELESKVKTAQEICNKLEQLPGTIKDVVDEFHSKIVAVMSEFVRSVIGHVEVRGDADGVEEGGSNPNMDAELAFSGNNTNGPESTSMHSVAFNHLDQRGTKKICPLHEQRNQRLRILQKQCDVIRNRAYARACLNEQLMQEGYNSNQWDLQSDRERRERIHDECRNGFLDSDDARVPRERATRAHAPLLRTLLPPTPAAEYVVPPLPQHMSGSKGNDGIEAISIMPSAVIDLEQRAGRLIITPERRRIKSEYGVASESRVQPVEMVTLTKVKSKHKRGEDIAFGESTAENVLTDNTECLPTPESTSHHGCVKKRKYGVIEPGPSSFFTPLTDDSDNLDGGGINNRGGDANVTESEDKANDLTFLE
ncbi:hypothetical protein DICVIV_04201 [Dictyocaulus viviparus]|uniref:RING-type domain-containing protein n=1 Tax=Dictyocaulus viviparus TaxID=29172 RepID=A0A0D8XYU4_DICVI|nr:hypothetical protein DICVIV_04201 [Dictyocaulus viviparus]